MNAFMIDLENKPGVLADVTEVLAGAGINITSVVGATCGDTGRLVLAVDDESAARTAFGAADWTYTEVEITTVAMRHAPGTLAAVARKLAAEGINIEAVMPLGMVDNEVTVGFVTSDPVTAKDILMEAGAAS
jgi:hypothetical protein